MRPRDIRKGDVVKFTSVTDPRITVTTFAKEDWRPGVHRWHSAALDAHLIFADWDLELVDRPLPPISEELLVAVRRAYVGGDIRTAGNYRDDWIKVVNTVREYDRNNNKESK